MKKFTLAFFLFTLSLAGYSTTWTIVNAGFSFSPATLTIMEGDTVIFDLDSEHNSAEVSQSTWNSNGNTPLPGGWVTGFGGGTVLPADLTEGTHWYVCQPHASGGMKGMIIVLGTTSIEDNPFYADIKVYPNPSNGQLFLSGEGTAKNFQLEVFDIRGIRLYATEQFAQKQVNEIEIPVLEKGIYIVLMKSDEGSSMRKIIVE